MSEPLVDTRAQRECLRVAIKNMQQRRDREQHEAESCGSAARQLHYTAKVAARDEDIALLELLCCDLLDSEMVAIRATKFRPQGTPA